LLSFSFLDGLLESFDLSARGSPSAACTSEEMGWWIECWTPPQCFGKLTQGERLQPRTLYVGTWGLFHESAPVWCVQVMLYEKELSYGVRVIWPTYHPAPHATLNARVQDDAHQTLTAFCQELQDLDSQRLSEKEKAYVQKIKDLQAWERVQEWKIQALLALSFAQKGIIQSLRGQLQKISEDVDDEQDDLTQDDYDVEDY
jgi:hypothetical protein